MSECILKQLDCNMRRIQGFKLTRIFWKKKKKKEKKIEVDKRTLPQPAMQYHVKLYCTHLGNL